MLYLKNSFSPMGLHYLTLFLLVGAMFSSMGIFAQQTGNNQNTNNSSFTVGVTAQVPCSCRPPNLDVVNCGFSYSSPFTFTLSATGGLDLDLTSMEGTVQDPNGYIIPPTSVAFYREVVTYQSSGSGKGYSNTGSAPIPTYSWVPLSLPCTIPANGTIKIKAAIYFSFCETPDPLGGISIPTGHYILTADFSGLDENGASFAGFAEHILPMDYSNEHLREGAALSSIGNTWSPNPSGDYAQLTLVQETEGQMTLQIVDMQGREIRDMTQRFHVYPGENKLKVSLASLPKGVYFAKVIGPQGVDFIQWVKL